MICQSKSSTSPLPFGADSHSHTRWRQTPSSPNQTYASFIEDAIALDQETGRAGSPIAPSIISELSARQKKRLRRYRRVWWIFFAVFLLLLVDTVISVVVVVEDEIHHVTPTARHLIWLLVSLTFTIATAVALANLYFRRTDRSNAEKEWAKAEVKKWKLRLREKGKEVERISKQVERLRGSPRGISHEASPRRGSNRSVSQGRTGKRNEHTEAEGLTTAPFKNHGRPNVDMEVAVPIQRPLPSHHPPRTSSLQQLTNSGLLIPFKDPLLESSSRISSFQTPDRLSSPSVAPSSPYRTTGLDQYVRAETLRQGLESRTSLSWTHHLDLDSDSDEVGMKESMTQRRSGEADRPHDAEVEHTHRALKVGHGEVKSLQSEDKSRVVNESEEYAVSDDERLRELRTARSRERVLPWTETLKSMERLDEKDSEGGTIQNDEDKEGERWIDEARKGFTEWMDSRERLDGVKF